MSSFLGITIGIVIFALVYFFYFTAFKLAGGVEVIKEIRHKKIVFAIILVLSVAESIFTAYMLNKNQFVYYWDNGGFWTMSFEIAKGMTTEPLKTLKLVYSTIRNEDYNRLLSLIISFPMNVFGMEYTKYIVYTNCLFLLPTYFIFAVGAVKIMATINKEPLKLYNDFVFATAFCTAMAFPWFTIPDYAGYIGSGALIPAALLVLILIDYDAADTGKTQMKKTIVIAGLIMLTLLYRRYYAAFALSVAVMLCVKMCIRVIEEKNKPRIANSGNKKNRKKTSAGQNGIAAVIGNSCTNIFYIGIIDFVVLLVFFAPLVKRLFFTDYSEQYVAYAGAFFDEVKSLFNGFGYIAIACIVVTIIYSVFRKAATAFVLEMVISALFAALSLLRIQYMGIQHRFVILIQVTYLIYIGFAALIIKEKKIVVRIAGLAMGIIFLSSYLFCFNHDFHTKFSNVSKLYSGRYEPSVRSDIAELNNLKDYLNSLTENTGDYVYVLASSTTLNYSIMQSLDKPYTSYAVNNQLYTHDIDLRDGFPTQFFSAKYIVCCNTVQTHAPEGTQEVISYLAEQVANADSAIGKHFEKNDVSFQLQNGVEAYVYTKTSDYSAEDIQSIADYYNNLYPDYASMFYDKILSVIN